MPEFLLALIRIAISIAALGGMVAGAMWIATPRRRPAVRSRRGWLTVAWFGIAVALSVLGSELNAF